MRSGLALGAARYRHVETLLLTIHALASMISGCGESESHLILRLRVEAGTAAASLSAPGVG